MQTICFLTKALEKQIFTLPRGVLVVSLFLYIFKIPSCTQDSRGR